MTAARGCPRRPPEAVQARDIHRIASGAEWYGYLTVGNLDAVAQRLTELIGSGRRFTSVYANEDFWAHRAPEVRTSQTGAVRVSRQSGEDRYAAITVIESGWSHLMLTDAANQAAALAMPEKRRPPYLRFLHDRVEIKDHAPAGNKSFQVFAVEERS